MGLDPEFNISRFKSYHHYLDSLIAEEDIRYLQDGELARLIGWHFLSKNSLNQN